MLFWSKVSQVVKSSSIKKGGNRIEKNEKAFNVVDRFNAFCCNCLFEK